MIDNKNRILVTRSSMPTLDEYVEEIRELWDSHWLTNMGKKHNQLAEELKKYLGVPGLELLVNGHAALEFTIQSFDFAPGSEVITTPFTFASTVHSIVRNNLTPVFCDIDPDTYCLNADQVEALITDKTVAILPVHVYGHVCEVYKLKEIAERHGLKLIYDAAHTFGEKVDGKGIGSFGDASIFSFHATKVYNTIEGGCVCFSDEELGKKVYFLKDFGIVDEENITGVGANGKMNEFAAAMGLCNLRHLKEEIDKRRKVIRRYRKNLGGVKGIKLGPDYEGGKVKGMDVEFNYAYFPVVFIDEFGAGRDQVFAKLAENNIGARKYFYPLINELKCYEDMGWSAKEQTPVAYDISMRVLTLPLFADLALDDVDRICEIILSTDNHLE
ncbi:MAG: DegT/DnrJ/EryC1/StrS family aminotransferase [Lachnospiraceae bacterium]|nr:DegT/DnrJ/EryC1/StrS family aminotransferase [Lachnospiraceae bacterium]